MYLKERLVKFPKLLAVDELRKAGDLLRKALLITTWTKSNSKRNKLVVDASSLNNYYIEQFSYRSVQSDVAPNIVELPKDPKVTLEKLKDQKDNWKLRRALDLIAYDLSLLWGAEHHWNTETIVDTAESLYADPGWMLK